MLLYDANRPTNIDFKYKEYENFFLEGYYQISHQRRHSFQTTAKQGWTRTRNLLRTMSSSMRMRNASKMTAYVAVH